MNEKRLWSPAELAEYLGVPVATIYQWRHQGTGPKGFRVGKHVRYRPADIRVWLESHADGEVRHGLR